MYNASMKQDIVKKKARYPVELTEMQRRFCEYLVMNEGRTTGKDAAIAAGYSPARARHRSIRTATKPKNPNVFN
jgi:phage terminase small subunit